MLLNGDDTDMSLKRMSFHGGKEEKHKRLQNVHAVAKVQLPAPARQFYYIMPALTLLLST